MSRLCSNSSRSYPGRPARRAALYKKGCVLRGNMRDDRAGVSRSHSRCRKFLVAELETSLAKRGWTHPTEGPNMSQGRLPNEFPKHVESERRSEHGARHGSTQPE
jgi:hypothetical protein